MKKVYYKNWYQHYLEEEKKKDMKLKRGYFSNLPEEEVKEEEEKQEEKQEKAAEQVLVPKRKRRRFGCLGILLPLSTISGFLFLWYQLDIGPIRDWVAEGLVFVENWVGTEEVEEAEDALAYQVALLEQHEAFVREVARLDFDGEMDLSRVRALYEELQDAHEHLTEVSSEAFDEAIRLWGFKLTSVNQMMDGLEEKDENLGEIYGRFREDQVEIGTMIREELELD